MGGGQPRQGQRRDQGKTQQGLPVGAGRGGVCPPEQPPASLGEPALLTWTADSWLLAPLVFVVTREGEPRETGR